jgi:hypothetical protein
MQQWKMFLAGMACLVMLAGGGSAKAMRIMAPSLPERVANSDLVIVGKVTDFGAKTVKSELFKGDMRQMQIAKVKVSDTVQGKAGKEIKVGFFPPASGPGGGPIRPGFRRGGLQLKIGQEGMFFLKKHPTQDVYVAQADFDFMTKTGNPGFAKELDAAKKAAKLLAKPKDGLKSKSADDRFLTAALLIVRYRTAKPGSTKTEQVSAEESKLILTTLADAEWTKVNRQFGMLNPMAMFYRLGLGPKDGWMPKPGSNIAEQAKKWLKDNAGKYRINRFVADEKKTEKPEPSK